MTPPVLQAEQLSRHYRVRRGLFAEPATVQALADVSFDVYACRTLAIVGESGCGKSTLARLLTMIEPPTAGTLRVDAQPVPAVVAALPPQLRRAVQIVFQNPYGALNPRQTVGAALTEPLRVHHESDARGREDAARRMLRQVGLRDEHYDRYPHMFSGGQRQRIAIARALMLNPSLLVLDEPVSALDLSVQAQVLNLLADLQDEFKLTYVFISHDLSVVRYIADSVMVMYFGEAVEYGTRDEVFENPQHSYTKSLFAATPRADIASIKARLAKKKAA